MCDFHSRLKDGLRWGRRIIQRLSVSECEHKINSKNVAVADLSTTWTGLQAAKQLENAPTWQQSPRLQEPVRRHKAEIHSNAIRFPNWNYIPHIQAQILHLPNSAGGRPPDSCRVSSKTHRISHHIMLSSKEWVLKKLLARYTWCWTWKKKRMDDNVASALFGTNLCARQLLGFSDWNIIL